MTEDVHNIAEPIAHLAVPIGDLHPYPRNPRRGNLTAIVESLAKNAQYRPIVVNQRNQQILAGNHTWQAAKKLGWTHLAVTYVDADDQQAARIVAVDNRANDIATYDFAELQALLETLPDLAGTGYTEDELNQLLAGQTTVVPPAALTDPDNVPDVPDELVAKLGDLWLLGPHRLLCGDATDVNAHDLLLSGKRPDLLLMDPPYGMRLDTDYSSIKGSLKSLGRAKGTQGNKYAPVIGDHEDYDPARIIALFDDVEEQFWWGADYYAERIIDRTDGSWLVWDKRKESQADAIGAEFELCWSRRKHKRRMLRHDWFGFLSSESPTEARNRVHPTQKPVALYTDILEQWGKGATLVLDLYGGSGTTIIACEKVGKTAAVMELSPAYVDVICRRWFEHTGIEPVLADRGEST